MTLDEFRATLTDADPPPGLPPLLHALWLDAKGDWDGAHNVAQEDESAEGSWVHAYLHRKEGDRGNAAYWYGRAKRPVFTDTLEREWESLARALLTDGVKPKGAP